MFQFAHSLVMCLVIFPLIQSANYLRSSFSNALQSTIMITLVISATLALLFGTFIANPKTAGISTVPRDASSIVQFAYELVHGLTRDAILDYDCGGSNVWVYACLHIVPSLIIFFKILTN